MKDNAIVEFIKKNWFGYIIGAAFLAITSYVQAYSPKIIGIIIDLFTEGNVDKNQIYFYLWMLVLVAVIAFFTRYIWRYFIVGGARKLERHLRLRLFTHLQTLPVEFYQNRKTGDLLAYGINDINAIRMTFGPGLAQSINALAVCVVSIVSMITVTNLKLTLMTLLPIPIIIVLMIKIGGLVQSRFKKVQENFGAVSDRVQENIVGLRVIKSYVQEKEEIEKFYQLNKEVKKSNKEMVKVSSMLPPLIEVFFGISFMVSLIVGSNMVKNNIISIGDFTAFNGYLTLIVKPVTSIGKVITAFQKGLASYKRLDEIFNIKSDINHFTGDEKLEVENGNIEIKNLTFTYPTAEEPALKNISLDLKQGQTLGIIGKTGSGKTTLANILLRLYNIEENKIFIDNKDINQYTLTNLRESIGYVPQDNFLFSANIEENIKFFRDIYSIEDVENATNLSCIYDNIVDFPYGFETQLGERGVNLSGGQKQRLSISRAIIKSPRILILDDALSAVDMKTEEKILANFRDILKDKTGIIIAHRISAIKDSDHIIVLDNGNIIEEGTHDELLAMEGNYYNIYNEQYNQQGEDKYETE